MYPPNDKTLEPCAYILFCFYYEAWFYGRSYPSAASYLERYREEVRATGQALAWLYLAEPDEESCFGFRPSNYMISLLVKPRKRILKSAKACASTWETETFDGMINEALVGVGDVPEMRGYVILALSHLGLIRCAKNGDVVPTSALLGLINMRHDAEERARWVSAAG